MNCSLGINSRHSLLKIQRKDIGGRDFWKPWDVTHTGTAFTFLLGCQGLARQGIRKCIFVTPWDLLEELTPLEKLAVVVISQVIVPLGAAGGLLEYLLCLLKIEETLFSRATGILDDSPDLGVMDHHKDVHAAELGELNDLFEERLLPFALQIDPLALVVDQVLLDLLGCSFHF